MMPIIDDVLFISLLALQVTSFLDALLTRLFRCFVGTHTPAFCHSLTKSDQTLASRSLPQPATMSNSKNDQPLRMRSAPTSSDEPTPITLVGAMLLKIDEEQRHLQLRRRMHATSTPSLFTDESEDKRFYSPTESFHSRYHDEPVSLGRH
jgi:hypothetical protein